MRRPTREHRSYAANMAFWCFLLIGLVWLWGSLLGNDDKAAGRREPHAGAGR